MIQSENMLNPTEIELEDLSILLEFKYDPILYPQQAEYRKVYNNYLAYFILKVVEANLNITLNKLGSLLRSTLQIPEDLSRTTACVLWGSETKMLKSYSPQPGITHIALSEDYKLYVAKLEIQHPELLRYLAPKYKTKETV